MAVKDRQTFELRAFDGWALEIIARLELVHPGFLIRAFYASSLKRQALFAALANIGERAYDKFVAGDCFGESTIAIPPALQELADVFTNCDAQQVVAATYGSCPRDYLVLLAQLGAAPAASMTFYRTAFGVCTRSSDGSVAS